VQVRTFRFCPWCGGPLAEPVGERQDCARCGEPSYLNPKPTASAILVDDAGRVLLGRRAIEPHLGLWDTPGGFTRPGESLEECVRRELREEAGVEIEVVRLVSTVPDFYGDTGEATVNAFYECRVLSGDPQPDDDVAELRWFERDALPPPGELAFDGVRSALAAWLHQTRDSLPG
jgi:ADP-ribose pyrophosphatase YjhB (NUDIX family)